MSVNLRWGFGSRCWLLRVFSSLPVTEVGERPAWLDVAAAAGEAVAERAAVAAAGHNSCRPLSAGTPAAPSGNADGPARPPACTSAFHRPAAVSILGP